MKLEPLLSRGKLVEGYETETVGGIVRTVHLFHDSKEKKEDVAYSVVYNILRELVVSASDAADKSGSEFIGLTGGVSYNATITRMFLDLVSDTGYRPILHREIPNGDGGVSIGQTAIALEKL
jgi:hydrogenase maturation protein HypF